MSGDIERMIRERAFEIWENEGRPQGRTCEHWEQARVEILEVLGSAGATKAAAGGASPATIRAERPGEG